MRLWKSNSLTRFVTDIYLIVTKFCYFPAGIYLLKVNKRNTRTRCEKCSKLTVKFWCLYCYLWTYFKPCSSVSIVNFEQVNVVWVCDVLFFESSDRSCDSTKGSVKLLQARGCKKYHENFAWIYVHSYG